MMNIYNLTVLFLTSEVSAQVPTPTVPIGSGGPPVSIERLTSLIEQVARFLISVAPVIAVIYIIWGGITYMAAGPDEEKVARAKARIKSALIGSLIVFGVGAILQTIAQFINGLTLF